MNAGRAGLALVGALAGCALGVVVIRAFSLPSSVKSAVNAPSAPAETTLAAVTSQMVGGVSAPVLTVRSVASTAPALTPPPDAGTLTAWTAQAPLSGTGSLVRVQVSYHRTATGWLLHPEKADPVLWTPSSTAALSADPAAQQVLGTAFRELAAWAQSDQSPWTELSANGGLLAVPITRVVDGAYAVSIDHGIDERRLLPGPAWTYRRVIPDVDRVHTFAMHITLTNPESP